MICWVSVARQDRSANQPFFRFIEFQNDVKKFMIIFQTNEIRIPRILLAACLFEELAFKNEESGLASLLSNFKELTVKNYQIFLHKDVEFLSLSSNRWIST